MAKRNKEYQKLPGTKKGFLLGKHTLWRGKDHLLQIFSRMGVEDYKRFYFSDIQAIITRKTSVGKVQNMILGGFILLLSLPIIVSGAGWTFFFAAVAGVLLIALCVNLFRGPTCETRLVTAVQTEKMYSLCRLKNTLKVMDGLQTYVQAVQGSLTPDDLAKGSARSLHNKSPKSRTKRMEPPKLTARHEKGTMHMILFMLLLLDGVLAGSGFFFTHVAATVLSTITGICMGIFMIIALVKQHNSDMSGSLRALTWTSLGYVGISFMAGYAISFIYAFKDPSVAFNQWEFFKTVSELSPWDNTLILAFYIYTLCGALFLGIPGLFLLKRSGDSKVKPVFTKSGRPLDIGNPLPG